MAKPLNLCEQIGGNKRYYKVKSLNYAHCLRTFFCIKMEQEISLGQKRKKCTALRLSEGKKLRPVHNIPEKIENTALYPHLGLLFTLNRHENGAAPYLKTLFKPVEV